MKLIRNIEELAHEMGSSVDSLARDVYKHTECGAGISWDDGWVTIGSIVEGSDAEFAKTFSFPVTLDEIDDWFEELERLTDEAWREANEDDPLLKSFD